MRLEVFLQGFNSSILIISFHPCVIQTPEDVGQLLHQGLVTVSDPDVRNIGPGDVISGDPILGEVRTKPVLLHLMRESAHQDRIPCQLAHVAAGHLPDLRSDAVLFHQRFLGEVELEGIIGRQGDVKTPRKILRQRRPENSVTRLFDFWNFLAINFVTKVAQMFGDFLGNCENHHILSQTGEVTFWATFRKTWATCNFKIWSY